jgi:hypothetical protein
MAVWLKIVHNSVSRAAAEVAPSIPLLSTIQCTQMVENLAA